MASHFAPTAEYSWRHCEGDRGAGLSRMCNQSKAVHHMAGRLHPNLTLHEIAAGLSGRIASEALSIKVDTLARLETVAVIANRCSSPAIWRAGVRE